jgi:hypothetical protein
MRRTLLLSIVFVLSAAALLSAGWWLGRSDTATAIGSGAIGSADPEPDITIETVGTGMKPPDDPTSGTTDITAQSSPLPAPAPLPPADVPLAQFYEELLDRATRGDSRTACRLASELQRCQRAAQARIPPEYLERRAANEQNERRRESMIDQIASIEVRREQTDALCEGVGEAQIANAFALQMQAAQADPDLRMWVALNPALDSRFFDSELEQWQQYRQVAVPWMEQAAASGDIGAVIALARVYGDSRRPGPMTPPLRQIDDARFVTYAALLDRYSITIPPVQRAASEARQRLDAATVSSAEARAESLFRPDLVHTQANSVPTDALRRSYEQRPEPVDCE